MINNFAAVFSSGSFFGLGFGLFALSSLVLLALMLVVIALKGYALWYAAKRDDKGWFIAILLINTIGILELVYLYSVVELWKKKPVSAPESKP
jgi:hypothetical protein